MKTIHTILREDFGWLDRELIRAELLGQKGISGVHCEQARNGLLIEYDPDVLDDVALCDVMCRVGVVPTTVQVASCVGDG